MQVSLQRRVFTWMTHLSLFSMPRPIIAAVAYCPRRQCLCFKLSNYHVRRYKPLQRVSKLSTAAPICDKFCFVFTDTILLGCKYPAWKVILHNQNDATTAISNNQETFFGESNIVVFVSEFIYLSVLHPQYFFRE